MSRFVDDERSSQFQLKKGGEITFHFHPSLSRKSNIMIEVEIDGKMTAFHCGMFKEDIECLKRGLLHSEAFEGVDKHPDCTIILTPVTVNACHDQGGSLIPL